MPCATSARCANAVTDPLPFVPAMCSEEKLRSGWPRAAHRVCMFCRPSLIPKFSSANRRSRDKGEVASYKLQVEKQKKLKQVRSLGQDSPLMAPTPTGTEVIAAGSARM